jgi:hypothetical protein
MTHDEMAIVISAFQVALERGHWATPVDALQTALAENDAGGSREQRKKILESFVSFYQSCGDGFEDINSNILEEIVASNKKHPKCLLQGRISRRKAGLFYDVSDHLNTTSLSEWLKKHRGNEVIVALQVCE